MQAVVKASGTVRARRSRGRSRVLDPRICRAWLWSESCSAEQEWSLLEAPFGRLGKAVSPASWGSLVDFWLAGLFGLRRRRLHGPTIVAVGASGAKVSRWGWTKSAYEGLKMDQ